MRISRRAKIAFFLTLGVLLAAAAVAVGSRWLILNWQFDLKVFLGFIFFAAIATGLVLNTSFLVREIRKSEQHDSFINAVTHELKTPIASIRLYLQTLERREVPEPQRREERTSANTSVWTLLRWSSSVSNGRVPVITCSRKRYVWSQL